MLWPCFESGSRRFHTAYIIYKLLRFSPKQHAAFDQIRVENLAEEDIGPRAVGIQAMCPTQWTVRGGAIESIIEHYDTLSQFWYECIETRLYSDVKDRITGVQTQMTTFDLLFGLQLSLKNLKITDDLSGTLQKQSFPAAEGHSVAELTVKTLKFMCTDANFSVFFSLYNCFHTSSNVDLPMLPQKRKAPRRYEIGTEDGLLSATVEDHYHQAYYV